METQFQIRELRDGLEIRTRRKYAYLFFALLAGHSARLQVTKFEFTGTSTIRRGKGPGTRRVQLNTADVRWLEYREEDAFEIRGLGTPGIYAIRTRGTTCILPFVDFLQASTIIQAIEARFSGLAEMWRANLQASKEGRGTENKP